MDGRRKCVLGLLSCKCEDIDVHVPHDNVSVIDINSHGDVLEEAIVELEPEEEEEEVELYIDGRYGGVILRCDPSEWEWVISIDKDWKITRERRRIQ